MLRLARAYFACARYPEAGDTLETLGQRNLDFDSPDGHLLYARVLEVVGDRQAALAEYGRVARTFVGPEAKCRYALLLRQAGDDGQAQQIFDEIVRDARLTPRKLNRLQKEWIDLARRHGNAYA